ncbi:MAG: macro domain-containing protein, partial [Candidatus Electryoneaceae bacterium]|nr:macro domain-containing protein [Candidatus Electryoneaceae bacterium]
NALELAFNRQFDTISFPALGTGIGGFAIGQAARIMLAVTLEFLHVHLYPMSVRFVLFDLLAFDEFTTVWEELIQ